MTTFKNLPPPPQTREKILAAVGPQRAQIYQTVRKILDDFEVVARWEQLYYPPAEIEEFLRIQTCLLSLIEEIPYRISEMTVQILQQGFTSLFDGVPDAIVDPETRKMILGLLDAASAASATQSTRRIAFEAVDTVPAHTMADAQKQLLKWMVDRHAPEPSMELSGEAFEESIRSFPDGLIDSSMKEILGNIQFYFDGIHEMTAGDVEKLRSRIEFFQTADADQLSAQERVFTCEISADLKGKYSSAVMGAASNLVSEGFWNGAEIEPILFPEKAEEFDRNDQLVEALRAVLESIRRFAEEVPLVSLVGSWERGKRVDRYALTHLYGFLGIIGKLMKESSRRALYSGDYHQIQLREHRLSNRINELNMLHNKTWEVLDETDPNIRSYYPQMVDKAVELAAVLDVELLKKMIGDESVRVLLRIVSMEGEKRKELEVRLGHEKTADYRTPESEALRGRLDERRHPVVALLYDEDLQTFLELLLGSVLKRASFAVKKRHAESQNGLPVITDEDIDAMAPPPAAPSPEEMVHFEDMSVLDVEILPEAPSMGPDAGEMPSTEPVPEPADKKKERLEAIEMLQNYLDESLTASHPNRKSFDLVLRLLTRKGMIPPTMMQSIVPFLEALTDKVVPQLAAVSTHGDIPITYQAELTQYCRDLSRRDLTPRQMQTHVVTKMEGLVNLLGDIKALTLELVDAHTPATSSAPGSSAPEPSGGDRLTSADDDFLTSIE